MKTLLLLTLIYFFSINSFSQEKDSTCVWKIPAQLNEDCDVSNGNDYAFNIYCDCVILDYKLSVFNRWGNLLFESIEIDKSWDASKEKAGTFYYTIEGTYDNLEPVSKKGYITVM